MKVLPPWRFGDNLWLLWSALIALAAGLLLALLL